MEIKEYRERVAELALDDEISDADFWQQETALAEQVLALRIKRAAHRLDPTTGEPRFAEPEHIENIMIPEQATPADETEITNPDGTEITGPDGQPWWSEKTAEEA